MMRCRVQSDRTPQNRALLFSLAQEREATPLLPKRPQPGSAVMTTLRIDSA